MWFLLPLAISLGTGESRPCCIRDINHPITLLWGHILPIQVSQAGGFLTFCQRSVAGLSILVSVVLLTWDPWKKNTIEFPSCRLDGLIALCLGRTCRMCSERNSSSWRTTQRRPLYSILFWGCRPPLPLLLLNSAGFSSDVVLCQWPDEYTAYKVLSKLLPLGSHLRVTKPPNQRHPGWREKPQELFGAVMGLTAI